MDDDAYDPPPTFFGIGYVTQISAEPPDDELPPRPFPIGFARPDPPEET